MLCVVLPALLFYAGSVFILTGSGFTLREILRDPAQQTGLSSFLGFVSNIRVWMWVSSVAICCFSLLTGAAKGQSRHTELLVLLGLLSLLIAVDDFFLLHERYVYQKGIFLFYAVCALSLLVRHFRCIIEMDGFSFMFAGLLLASSIIIDMKQRKIPFDYAQVQVLEEGCKFIGAALWLFFCGRTAADRLSPEK
ncbi:MAG: oxidase [Gammaproteobacteria bacterium]|nr:oxidase [Gammaproteobacteria bacterium]